MVCNSVGVHTHAHARTHTHTTSLCLIRGLRYSMQVATNTQKKQRMKSRCGHTLTQTQHTETGVFTCRTLPCKDTSIYARMHSRTQRPGHAHKHTYVGRNRCTHTHARSCLCRGWSLTAVGKPGPSCLMDHPALTVPGVWQREPASKAGATGSLH